MKCYECSWPRISRTRNGAHVCPRCGAKARADLPPSDPGEQPSRVVKAYTVFFAVLGLTFPFFVPLIVKLSLAYPMDLGAPW